MLIQLRAVTYHRDETRGYGQRTTIAVLSRRHIFVFNSSTQKVSELQKLSHHHLQPIYHYEQTGQEQSARVGWPTERRMSRVDERPRSSSLSDATLRGATRPLSDARVGSSVTVGGAALGGSGGPPALPRKESERIAQDGGSQPASGRASPALSSRSLRAGSSSQRAGSFRSPTMPSSSVSAMTQPPTFKTLDSYTSRHVVAALEPGPSEVRGIDDVWQAVCVRVLPL